MILSSYIASKNSLYFVHKVQGLEGFQVKYFLIYKHNIFKSKLKLGVSVHISALWGI